MSIRRIGIAATEPQPETIPLEEVAARLGRHIDLVRRAINADERNPLPRPRIPGGRKIGGRHVVIRAVFERAMRDGIEPEPRPVTQGPDLVAVLEAVITTLKSA